MIQEFKKQYSKLNSLLLSIKGNEHKEDRRQFCIYNKSVEFIGQDSSPKDVSFLFKEPFCISKVWMFVGEKTNSEKSYIPSLWPWVWDTASLDLLVDMSETIKGKRRQITNIPIPAYFSFSAQTVNSTILGGMDFHTTFPQNSNLTFSLTPMLNKTVISEVKRVNILLEGHKV